MIRSLDEIYHGTLSEYINALRDHVNRIMKIRERTKTQTTDKKKLQMQNANNAIDDN